MAANTNTTIVRTLTFLPEIFQTTFNSQFLAASLDQLVNPPIATKVQGYVGSKFGYGVNATDYYVPEPTAARTNYQLDPGVVFTAPPTSETEVAGTATDFISYPGMIDALTMNGGEAADNNTLFTSQFYSWDSFTDLDKLINFNEYYWLPEGPPAVTVAATNVYSSESYLVTDLPNGYQFSIEGQSGSSINPSLTLLRGGTYTFTVSQASQFWIQTFPGTSGFEPAPHTNITTREVYGVTNNGADAGIVTFTVPAADAQAQFLKPGNLTVDLVSTTPFQSINGQLLSSFGNIDGVTSLDGLTVMFYGTGITPAHPTAYISSYLDEVGVPYDTNSAEIQAVAPLTLTVGSSTSSNFTLLTGDTNMLTIGSLVTFADPVFGGVNAGQFYYISSIVDSVTFAISNTPGGPSITLTPDSGLMIINFDNVVRPVQSPTVGSVVNYTNIGTFDQDTPTVQTFDQTETVPNTNPPYVSFDENFTAGRFVLSSGTTNNMVINTTVTFDEYAFGGITAGQVYYINSIIDSVTFSISETIGGPDINLSPGFGAMLVNIGQGQLEDGFTTTIRDNFYTIQYGGDPANPIITLMPSGAIPINQQITPIYGQKFNNILFYRDAEGDLQELAPITAPLNTLYYQDSVSTNSVGIISLIDNNTNNGINVDTEILGRTNYTAPNGVVFTNGLKVQFSGTVIPSSYLTGEYYVQGVGTAIELVPFNQLICPENFTEGNYVPFSSDGFDITNWDVELFVPVLPDYITIARNSLSRNPWSRSNRWFHIDVINATATYNNNPAIATTYATPENKASRPIIEFYPNLKLFDSGIIGASPVDFIDTRTESAFTSVAGALNYYPDVQVYTATTATIAPAVNTTSTTITISAADVTGTIENLMYIADSLNQLPTNSQITSIAGTTMLTITVTWSGNKTLAGGTASLVASATTLDNYALFSGARVIFAADTDPNVRGKIYISEFSTLAPHTRPVITLTVAEDGICVPETQTVALRGYNYKGVSFWYDGLNWNKAQQKLTVPQPPLFDIFDANGISLGDTAVYLSSSFVGCKLFSYQIGSGPPDSVLGFPVTYSSIANAGDISFDVSLNSDTFSYVSGGSPITDQVNIGYVYNYTSGTGYVRQLGWQTAVAPSAQYQNFSFNFNINKPVYYFNCDIAALPEPTGVTKAGLFVTGGTYTIQFVGTTDFTSFGSAANIIGETFVANLTNPISVNTMISGFEYKIVTLDGTNWNSIGVNGTPTVGNTFIYNGNAVTGSGTVSGADAGSGVANSIGWPTVQVYINNVYQDPNNYEVTVGTDTTTIRLFVNPTVSTAIQVLILSNQVSKVAYYSIPINLNNNPLNQDPTIINYGDISSQYRDIFVNAPNTTGNIYGSNNFRDCGNLVPYGTKIIQNSASLVLPGAFLRTTNNNLFDALMYNSREYINYKQLIVNTVQNTEYVQRYTPSQILNEALIQITASRSEINSFFWSDMIPSHAPYISNTYTFNNGLDVSIYPLSQVYNFSSANYNGVLVYLYRVIEGVTVEKQLTSGVDYIISTTSPSLSITVPLIAGDQVIINEYTQTFGSYVPNTPTKLGMYPSFQPGVVLDSDYLVPTYFVRGHDGSFTKLYGDYDPVLGVLIDFRDQALLEFELRVYNNLKLSTTVPISKYEIVPGFFRNTNYTWDEFINIYSPLFLNWVGQNRLDYKKQYYTKLDTFSYNYTNSGNKLTGAPIQQGYWRGVYEYFYDTTTPNETPWEMLGFTDQPTWWVSRYGPAPYTSNNGILWGDLEAGYIWNDGNPYVNSLLSRPGLSKIIPVDSSGKLLPPINSIVGNYNPSTFQKEWVVGDDGPVELSYRRSSTYPFDVMRIFALTKPAEFYNLGVWLDGYKYNSEFNQYLVNDRNHLTLDKIPVYGNGTPVTSYINWIVDYLKQQGVDATSTITTLLNNLDVRLVYRLAGYSAKNQLQFYVEKPSPTNINSSLLIPDESYNVLLYNNQPFDEIMYSGVVVQENDGYWTVYGNSQSVAYFEILNPKYTGSWKNITILNQTIKVTNDYYDTTTIVPYGTIFYNTQDLGQFLLAYGARLEAQGMVFDQLQNGITLNWTQMVYEFLYWSQTGWNTGSIITLNPAADSLTINRASSIVQPLTVQDQNFILNQNLYPINLKDLCVNRDGTIFNVHTLNTGDAMSYGQFNISNFENGIVFDNVTIFNDVIYNLVTGLRQNRIKLRGTKSAKWDGTVNSWGFIYNQDNILPWDGNAKYTKGEIVHYKNQYWASQQIIQPSLTFDQTAWKLINYDSNQSNLLANPSTRAYESTLYYDIYQANLENDADLLAFSLIGYRPRDYLALIDLTDTAQVQLYQNLIVNKGTLNAISAFNGANLPQGGIQYKTFENWSIKLGDYGGVLNQNFVDFKVNQANMTGDPSIVSLTDGSAPPTPGSMQVIPTYDLFNYGTAPTSSNILATTSAEPTSFLYPSAGYVNFKDVKMSSYFYSGLPIATDINNTVIPIENFYVGQYLWLANFKEKWGVYGWKTIGEVTTVQNNLNQTATITFSQPHGLKALDPIAIVNFATAVDGYYLVVQVVNLTQVTISLNLPGSSTATLQGVGLGMSFENHRVATPSELVTHDLTQNEFINNVFWVDENTDGDWAVYKKTINYQNENQLEILESTTLGSAVAYVSAIGYLIGDAGAGKVYRYEYSPLTKTYSLVQELSQGISFGSKIVHNEKVFVVTQPENTPAAYVYILNDTVLTLSNILLIQTINPPAADAVAMSEDANWIYVSDTTNNLVYVYRRENISLESGYFVNGETYIITSLGTTDFTAMGSPANLVGMTFEANLSKTVLAEIMISGCEYEIATLDTTNWNDIGYVGTPTVGGTFTYNGATVSGIGTVSSANLGDGVATQVSYKLLNTIAGSDVGAVSGDKFGFSLSTNNGGDTLVVGSPFKNYSGTIENWGTAYTYQRTLQNFVSGFNSIAGTARPFSLVWTPDIAGKASTTVTSSQYINVISNADLEVNMPIVFTGTNFGLTGIQPNFVYYVAAKSSTNKFSIKTSRSTTTPVALINGSGLSFTAYAQSTPLYVYVNGILVPDNLYAVIGSTFYYFGSLLAGDIITVNGNQFTLAQTFTSKYTNRTGVEFSYAMDMDTFGTNILIGSPYEINTNGEEGAVYSYINGGARYGVVIGTADCNVTGNKTVLINGFAVNLPAGNAASVASVINSSNVINVQASSTSDNKLIIQLVNKTIAPAKNKLVISAFDDTVLTELGITLYTQTQTITCPHTAGPTEFGSTIKINGNSVVISAPVATRFEGTVFDFVNVDNLDKDTLFDNNATQFIDTYPNAGTVYMFDYLSNYKENLSAPGSYIYAQGVNDTSTDYGYEPRYGTALDFNDNVVVVGTPNFMPTTQGGQVVPFVNAVGTPDWAVYRSSAPVVDINTIQNTQLYSAITNETLVNFDYIDPLQGKILGAARENLDYVTGTDPAKYNVDLTGQSGMLWGAAQVGKLWFNTSNVRFVNYHQPDAVYNSKYWGRVFPGSDVAVYSWIASFIPPINYQGPGVPYDINTYSVNNTLDASNVVSPVYYFWVRNTNVIFTQTGKTLSDSVVSSYIANPSSSGISYMAPLLPNTMAMYNSLSYFNNDDTVFHIGFSNGESTDVYHQEFALIQEGNPDSFLPGIPPISLTNAYSIYGTPFSLYARLLDSLSGCDQAGTVVPNPFLPIAVQSGIESRPKQSFFYDRYLALENYLMFANTQIPKYPIFEIKEELSFLFTSGEFYNTKNYWDYINWYAPGYNENMKPAVQVAIYADLAALNPATGTLVKVLQNGAGKYEIYVYNGAGSWTRVGLENGTLAFSSYLWDYSAGSIGWDGNFYDTAPYSEYPSQETWNIIRALNEQIYTGDLLIYRNASLILLFEYIQSETSESQNFLPWLNKTSLLNVSHTVRELYPYETYRTDDQIFLEGYINEAKPYHVVITDFLFEYTGNDYFQGDVTDFDVPAQYNYAYQEFISPQLVYTANASPPYQYTLTDPIWQTQQYNQWFQNFGITISGQPDYKLAVLESYLTTGTRSIIVSNASGFPVAGIITIGSEQIGYSSVNRATNTLNGLTRGVNGTTRNDHLPGTAIYMDLPAVVVLDSGRNYSNPPKITAYIDTTKYPTPVQVATFEAVMSFDSVLQINVTNPGQGYAVTPELIVDPATTTYFTNTDINSETHTIAVYPPTFETGDQVQYFNGTGSGAGKLHNGQWYYVGVLNTTPTEIIALYSTASDAINDTNRILIYDAGTSTAMKLNLGARAFVISSASPTRENNITIKFDRTSYTSQVQDWVSSEYYGSYFAGNFNNSNSISSSGYTLQNVNPDINENNDTVLASAQGFVLEIADVQNDRQMTWSSFIRYVSGTSGVDNSITLITDNSNPNASGSTLGFYVGMPIQFQGSVVGGLVDGVKYYVHSVIDEFNFTVSTTEFGSVFVLTTATVPISGLQCLVGEVVDTAILTVNYPGIIQATATQSAINAITVPLTAIGTGGTVGFYPNLALFFTGTAFGGILTDHTYYVTSVIDDQHFTMSLTENALTTTLTATASGTNVLTVDSTSGFSVNTPLIINSMVIAGSPVTNFGNIVSGTTYYVRQILSSTEMIISNEINGAEFGLADQTGTAALTSQANTVPLTTATGSMTMNVLLPVSPGQVNGQLFTMYSTSPQYVNITDGVRGNLIQEQVPATIAGINGIALAASSYFDNIYINMPFQLSNPIGGLLASTTYYVLSIGAISVTVTSTSSNYDLLNCNNTSSLYVNMPIVFSGNALGGTVIGKTYYVYSIVDGTHFTISEDKLVIFALQNDYGTMIGTGENYITASASQGGPIETVTTDIGGSLLTQEITGNPTFSISDAFGSYSAIIVAPGSGFAVNNTITISGTEVGGTTPKNDVTLTVNTIDSIGRITSVIVSGISNSINLQYYLKVYSPNQFEVYSNPLMTVPVSGIDFPYKGFAEATVTSVSSSGNYVVVSSVADLALYDPVVFTGKVQGGLTVGTTYYIASISGTHVTVSAIPAGAAVTLSSVATTSFTIAKANTYAFLPEPFYFNQSIVKYGNRVWRCIVSNNDTTFIFGKWELLDSGDNALNAMDRTIGYYQPTINMPGVDLTQLFDGVAYPNPIYYGNAFQPSQQYTLDTILQGQQGLPTTNPLYDVQGAPFPYGYGPEELVPGVITDNLALIVNTRPGSTWNASVYANTGYGVASVQFPGGSTAYSFDAVSQTPAEVSVQIISTVTGLGTTLSPTLYTVDWINKVVNLISPTTQGVRIDVYEVGNGNQLVKSNTDNDPIRVDATTGFNEIYLDCNYSASLYNGSGVVQPNTDGVVWTAPIAYHNGTKLIFGTSNMVTQTSAADNSITTNSTAGMNLNDAIVFNKAIGGLNTYTVGSFIIGNIYTIVSLGTTTNEQWNTIAGSADRNYIVGSTFECVNIGTGFGTGTASTTTTYYVKSILTGTKFTISATLGGPVLTLSNETVIAYFVTNDYAFGAQTNTQAKIIFATKTYSNTSDYIVYSVFGQTDPVQYSYAIPETQTFTSAGSTTFTLTNYITQTSADNAIVEIDGVRQTPSSYTINIGTNVITFGSAPTVGSLVTVTTYNDTAQQYLTTQSGLTGNVVSAIATINTTITTGHPAVSVQTTVATGFSENDLVTIDGVIGTTQLNGNSYYIHIIDSLNFGLYTQRYVIGGPNYPVTAATGYVSGGFVWQQGTYCVATTIASASDASNNGITVTSTANLLVGTPVYFSAPDSVNGDDVLGGLIQGTEYYVNLIIDANRFTVSEKRYGADVVLSTVTNTVNVSQWDQTNVDRLWVTVDGLRVPSSNLVLSDFNQLSILTQIASVQEVIITSMVPNATPNEETYINFVDQSGMPSVYRANSESRTWLTQTLNAADALIHVNDVMAITTTVTQQSTVPVAIDYYYYIGLDADKTMISYVSVMNDTTSTLVDPNSYTIVLRDSAPFLKISQSAMSTGNSLTITILEGNVIYVDGEEIGFSVVDMDNNTLSGLRRGANGTGVHLVIPEYAEVYGLLSTNRLRNVYYDTTWNSYVYNKIDGDPLQISVTYPARFLQTDIT